MKGRALRDGAPSDHTELECRKHGVCVWKADEEALTLRSNGKQRLRDCKTTWPCRAEVVKRVRDECCKKIVHLGDMFGRDRMCVNTVAFGPPDEDYVVLEEMAKQLPRSSFQKLGLSAANLRSAMTSLSSSLTTLRTSGGTHNGLTMRNLKPQENIRAAFEGNVIGKGRSLIYAEHGWHIYGLADVVSKSMYNLRKKAFVQLAWSNGAKGVAMRDNWFAKGVERASFWCTEVADVKREATCETCGVEGARFTCTGCKFAKYCSPACQRAAWVSHKHLCPKIKASAQAQRGEGIHAEKCGETLVAKETLYSEQLRDNSFHTNMCKVQAEAQELAELFNARLGEAADCQVNFVDLWIYEVLDPYYESGRAWILAEPELEGKFMKWNNNAGSIRATHAQRERSRSRSVTRVPGGFLRPSLGIGAAIIEEDEEEDDGGDAFGYGGVGGGASEMTWETDDIPQCFSHFTWSVTDGKRLVCDLQGVWNRVDGFVLTDPALHYHKGRHKHGGTDKGQEGIENILVRKLLNFIGNFNL